MTTEDERKREKCMLEDEEGEKRTCICFVRKLCVSDAEIRFHVLIVTLNSGGCALFRYR